MKKRLGILAYACAAALASQTLGASADPVRLQDFHWQNRLIVDCDLTTRGPITGAARDVFDIVTDDEDNVRRLAVVQIVSESGAIFFVQDLGVESLALESEDRDRMMSLLNCGDGERVIGLIGLDGGVKHVWRDDIPSVDEVYALIDAMPMRLQEMRRD